jgi:hypothetical protein
MELSTYGPAGLPSFSARSAQYYDVVVRTAQGHARMRLTWAVVRARQLPPFLSTRIPAA